MTSALAKAAKNINTPKATASADAVPTIKEWDTAIPTYKAGPSPKSLTEAADLFKKNYFESTDFKNLPLPEQKRVLEMTFTGMPNPTPEAITKGYRKLSLKLHPDKPGGDTKAFQDLGNAHERLLDPKNFIPAPNIKAQTPTGQPTYNTAVPPPTYKAPPTYQQAVGQPAYTTGVPIAYGTTVPTTTTTALSKTGMSTGAKVAIGATAVGATTAAVVAGVGLSSGASSSGSSGSSLPDPAMGFREYGLPEPSINSEQFQSLFTTGNVEYET